MIPRATYRLQLNRDFGFADAAALIPYLSELGISHCYLSPYLKARAGSMHGYDIVDHNALNPELGSHDDFLHLVTTLRAHGMGHFLDLVPNHMGVGGDDNQWWLDLLENGRASPYTNFFDIDWSPGNDALREKLVVPILSDHYGKVLERGELELRFDAEHGELSVHYMNHRLPLDPQTYPVVLSHCMKRLELLQGKDESALREFRRLLDAFAQLPARNEISRIQTDERRRNQLVYKQQLSTLYRECPEIAAHLISSLTAFNVGAGNSLAGNTLHRLLDAQVYRLAYWRVASDEINYRRFFDINDLAGLCVERPEVFEATHKLVLELFRSGLVDGLRIDHPDGLYDPSGYFRQLAAALFEANTLAGKLSGKTPCYLVAEKILAPHEKLPREWPLHGTTGYDFASRVNGLFVRPGAEVEMDRIYRRFTGNTVSFEEMLYRSKRLVMEVEMFGELDALGRQLDHLTEQDRNTRDFTANSLRNALKEIVACFPVYRTYICEKSVSDMDRQYIDWAVAEAKLRSPAADITVFDVIRTLILDGVYHPEQQRRSEITRFVMRFQQYTSPVIAKALEDTSLYNYNRLLSLNEVGSDPRQFGSSLAVFHNAAIERLKNWPATMLATSTHDNKRSEDVRARLNVLSELPAAWKAHIGRWSRINRRYRRQVENADAPSRNDEYFLYQTLLGSWPLETLDEEGLARYRERIRGTMLKAIREAKSHTSWINVNQAYEDAVINFVDHLLACGGKNQFLNDFDPFARTIARLGLFNSLSQTLLKLTSPGVPDIYQGCELWDFSLVDPDNRRTVDYAYRRTLMNELQSITLSGSNIEIMLDDLLGNLEDGRAKLYLIQRILDIRREIPRLFETGDYSPLEVDGERSEYLCAFARFDTDSALIAVAPRWFAELCGEENRLPLGEPVWGGTTLIVPDILRERRWCNLFDGGVITVQHQQKHQIIPVAAVLGRFPAAVLVSV